MLPIWRTRMAVLAGARASVLARVPDEADRFTQILPLLFATAALSSISMAFAIATGVLHDKQLAWIPAILIAPIWGALIFIVDRALTASMKSTKNWLRMFGTLLPRVLLAALIGFVVSGPLVLQVFANDIRQEMSAFNLGQGSAQQAELEQGPEYKRLDTARNELNRLKQQAQTGMIGGVESASQATLGVRARVEKLQEQVSAQRDVLARATALYVCERYGRPPAPGCTGVAGAGSAFQSARETMNREQAAFDQLARQLEDAQGALGTAEQADAENATSTAQTNRDEAQTQLPAAQTEYEDALAAYTAKSESISQANRQALGLLAQMRALERIQSRDAFVAMLHWAIALLFIAIELMPVIVKAFRSWGDLNPYELAEMASTTAAATRHRYEQGVLDDQLTHDRQRMIDQLEHQRDDARRHREARAAATLAVEQDMLDREVIIGQEQNARVAARMESVVGEALDEWERQVDRVLAEQPVPESPIVPIPDESPRRWIFPRRA